MRIFKGYILEALLVSIAIMVLGACLKSGIDNFTDKDRQVTVKGLSEMKVKADKATWNICVSESSNEIKPLYATLNSSADKVVAFLEKNGIKKKDITVAPPTVTDNYETYYGGDNRPTFRYSMSTNVCVSTTDVDVIKAAVARKGDMISAEIMFNDWVNYDYTAFKTIKSKMMDEAIANAQKTAEQFATTSGSKLNKITTADQGQFIIDDSGDNEPTMKQLRVVTTITYSLKD